MGTAKDAPSTPIYQRHQYISGIRLERPFRVLRLVVSGAMSQDGWRFLCWLF
jgi:hypothetical protein